MFIVAICVVLCHMGYKYISKDGTVRRYKRAKRSPKTGRGNVKEARKRRKQRGLLLIREAKRKPCHDCDNSYHYSLMEFDHRGGEIKKFTLSSGGAARLNKEIILKEIAKCDVVCCLCHRVRTWNRQHPEEQIPSLTEYKLLKYSHLPVDKITFPAVY